MAHAITLEVSQDVYELLAEQAQQRGQPPEVLAAEWLSTASHYLASDPLESLIGTLETNIPDWGERHDYYLGQALLEELRNDMDETSPSNG